MIRQYDRDEQGSVKAGVRWTAVTEGKAYIPRLGGPRAEIVPDPEAPLARQCIRYHEVVRRAYREMTCPSRRDVVRA